MLLKILFYLKSPFATITNMHKLNQLGSTCWQTGRVKNTLGHKALTKIFLLILQLSSDFGALFHLPALNLYNQFDINLVYFIIMKHHRPSTGF